MNLVESFKAQLGELHIALSLLLVVIDDALCKILAQFYLCKVRSLVLGDQLG